MIAIASANKIIAAIISAPRVINSLNVIYNLADFLNKIIFGMIIYSAALEDTRKGT